jgi:hypothetical protein
MTRVRWSMTAILRDRGLGLEGLRVRRSEP